MSTDKYVDHLNQAVAQANELISRLEQAEKERKAAEEEKQALEAKNTLLVENKQCKTDSNMGKIPDRGCIITNATSEYTCGSSFCRDYTVSYTPKDTTDAETVTFAADSSAYTVGTVFPHCMYYEDDRPLEMCLQGPRGFPGPPGERGPTGAKGDTGAKGVDGRDGRKGAQGEQGEQGQKGDRGLKGERGTPGLKGDSGAKGVDGRDGRDGVDCTDTTWDRYWKEGKAKVIENLKCGENQWVDFGTPVCKPYTKMCEEGFYLNRNTISNVADATCVQKKGYGEACDTNDQCMEDPKELANGQSKSNCHANTCCSIHMTDANCAVCDGNGWCFKCKDGYSYIKNKGCTLKT